MELDHNTTVSSSKLRRLRDKKVKGRLWSASQSPSSANSGGEEGLKSSTVTPHMYGGHLLFENNHSGDVMRLSAGLDVLAGRLAFLEASLCFSPSSAPMVESQSVDATNGYSSFWNSCDGMCYTNDDEICRDNVDIRSEIAGVCATLDILQDELCKRLYSDTSISSNTCENHHLGLAAFLPNLTTCTLAEKVEEDMSVKEPGDKDVTDLNNISRCLNFLQEAASIAHDIESGNLILEDVVDDDNSLQHYLMRQYRSCVPAGIEQRLIENEEIERELTELEVNWWGHLFVFQRPQFLAKLKGVPEELRRMLVQLAVQNEASKRQDTMNKHEYEDLFFASDPGAYAWQDSIPDSANDEDSVLLLLLQTLRKVVG